MKKREVVHIRWDDAAHQKGPIWEDDFNKHYVVSTIGMKIEEDKKYITVAMDRWEEGGSWRDVQHIPKGMILSKKRVGWVEV